MADLAPRPPIAPAPAPAPNHSQRLPEAEAIVRVEGLIKRYKRAATNAVDGVSFAVAPGEFFVLLGPNGAGKTTTISILTTTLMPTSGRVTIAGHDLAREASAVRRDVGIIFQRPSLDLNLTAEENVRFHAVLYGLYPFRPSYRLMPRAYRERVEELAAVLEIEHELFKPMKTFSGGMRRKLEIVRSLVHRPRVLFLDEPTTGLDPQSRRNLWQYLREVRASSGTTMVLTTHYLAEAEDADTICVLNHGRVVAYGSPDQVKSQTVRDSLLVDATDRAALLTELAQLGVPFEVPPAANEPIRLPQADGASTHALLRAIETPLSLVQTHSASLEDAYLALLHSARGANGDAGSDADADLDDGEADG